MSTVSSSLPIYLKNDYPTSDGKPMAETDWHRMLMIMLIESLDYWFQTDPLVYVSGNLLIFYEPGNKRRHISPDVFVVKGVPKAIRPNYLTWEEGRTPNAVIELSSSSTRREDIGKKFRIYQDVLKVREYFLFDPYEDYLDPSLQGYRRRNGLLHPIKMVDGRLPSRELGLHLERSGIALRLYNPAEEKWLPTTSERLALSEASDRGNKAEIERLRAELLRRPEPEA